MHLSERQKAVLELRENSEPPMSFAEIGRRLGISRPNAFSAFRQAQRRLRGEAKTGGGQNAIERKDPEKAAELIDGLTDPLRGSVAQVARECGVSPDTARALQRRLGTRYQPFQREVQGVKASRLYGLSSDRALRILETVDDGTIAKANLKDRAIAVGILLDKRQKLDPESRQRMTNADRLKLSEIIPMLVKIAKERGIDLPDED